MSKKLLCYSLLLGVALSPVAYFLGNNYDAKFITPEEFVSKTTSDLISQRDDYKRHAEAYKSKLGAIDPKAQKLSLVLAKYSFEDIFELARMGLHECPYTHSSNCEKSETIAVMYTAINQQSRGIWGNATIADITRKKLSNGVFLYSYWSTKGANAMMAEEKKYIQEYIDLAVDVLAKTPEAQAYNFGQTHHCNASVSACAWHKSSIQNGKLIYLGNINHAQDFDMPAQIFIKVLPIGKHKSQISKHFFAKQK